MAELFIVPLIWLATLAYSALTLFRPICPLQRAALITINILAVYNITAALAMAGNAPVSEYEIFSSLLITVGSIFGAVLSFVVVKLIRGYRAEPRPGVY